MSKLFIRFLFVVMAAVMIVTACGTASVSPTAYVNPATQAKPTLIPETDVPTAEVPATDAPLPTEPAAAPGAISFSADILPILESRCVNCHGGNKTEKRLDLKSYESLMNGSEKGPVLVAGDAANSSLATLISNGKMPRRGPKLTPEQIELIIAWINAGALNN
ncbi:MAG: c-type cytochrome [Chloroflexi bacterium]|nr:c-type cytochrome [Chloroflexota bacterium]